MTFLPIIALRNKTVAHTDTFFHCSTINANGRLSQQRLLRSRHFATMVTWRHKSPLFWNLGTFLVVSSCSFNSSTSWACFWRSCPMAASWAAVSSSTLFFRAASSDSRLFLMSWAAVVVSIDSSSSVFRVSSSFKKRLITQSDLKPVKHLTADQCQFSPNSIKTQLKEIMKINKIINKGKMRWSFTKFSQLIP